MVRQSASSRAAVPWPREKRRGGRSRGKSTGKVHIAGHMPESQSKGGWAKSGCGSWSGAPNGDATPPHLVEHPTPCGVPRNNPWGIWAAEAVFHSRRPVETCSFSTLRRHLAACHGASSSKPSVIPSNVVGKGDEAPRKPQGRVRNRTQSPIPSQCAPGGSVVCAWTWPSRHSHSAFASGQATASAGQRSGFERRSGQARK